MSILSKLADIKYYYSTHLTFILETVASTMHFWGYRITFLEDGVIKAIKDPTVRSVYGNTDIKLEDLPADLSEKLNIQINHKPDTIKNYILKMGLITYFSLFEAFNKDYFQELYNNMPHLMKSKKNALNAEDLLEFKTMEDLHKHLALKEVEKFGYLNIDEIADLLDNKFKIDLRKDLKSWLVLRESYYRRNIIVHTDGKVSITYLEKCPSEKLKLGQELLCDIEHIWKRHSDLQSYMDFIHKSIEKKFHNYSSKSS